MRKVKMSATQPNKVFEKVFGLKTSSRTVMTLRKISESIGVLEVRSMVDQAVARTTTLSVNRHHVWRSKTFIKAVTSVVARTM